MTNSRIDKIEVRYYTDTGENCYLLEKSTGFTRPSLRVKPGVQVQACLTDQEGRTYHCSYEQLKRIENGEPDDFTEQEKQALSFLFDAYGEIVPTFSPILIEDAELPLLSYTDYTEQYVMNYDEISQVDLQSRSKGVWLFYGTRLLRFHVTDPLYEESDAQMSCELRFRMLGNKALDDPFIVEQKDIIAEPVSESSADGDFLGNARNYTVRLDTERLGQLVCKHFPDKQSVMCTGEFRMCYRMAGSVLPDSAVITFPVRFELINTAYFNADSEACLIDANTPVSIDFGTSSTCIAIGENGFPELLRLNSSQEDSDTGLNENPFENPTVVRIINWDKMYPEWRTDPANPVPPLIYKCNTAFEKEEHFYDYGYNVKRIGGDTDFQTLISIISGIKLIPHRIASGFQERVIPKITRLQLVELTDTPEDLEEEKLDPVELYGYILGRAINNPLNGKIYTRYLLTYPVKFNEPLRKKLLRSLESGIRRALPHPVDTLEAGRGPLVRVTMEYPEPVACIGAVCGDRLSTEDGTSKLFGLFDFGGGTLDFTFGILRQGDPKIEEDNGWENVLEIMGVDGDGTIGGERLINYITYLILTANRTLIENYSIPFLLPDGEKKPTFLHRCIQEERSASTLAQVNHRRVNETISRELFENMSDSQEQNGHEEVAIRREIDLYTNDGSTVAVQLAIDKDRIRDEVAGRIWEAVELFVSTFRTHLSQERNQKLLREFYYEKTEGDTIPQDTLIFLAGNASRHPLVKKYMCDALQEYLGDSVEDHVILIDEKEPDENYENYSITPKTAVAIGQLALDAIDVRWHRSFGYMIAMMKGIRPQVLIQKGASDRKWVFVSPIRNSEVTILYSTVGDVKDRMNLRTKILKFSAEDNGKLCYIRPYEESALQYIAVTRDVDPDEAAEVMTEIPSVKLGV